MNTIIQEYNKKVGRLNDLTHGGLIETFFKGGLPQLRNVADDSEALAINYTDAAYKARNLARCLNDNNLLKGDVGVQLLGLTLEFQSLSSWLMHQRNKVTSKNGMYLRRVNEDGLVLSAIIGNEDYPQILIVVGQNETWKTLGFKELTEWGNLLADGVPSEEITSKVIEWWNNFKREDESYWIEDNEIGVIGKYMALYAENPDKRCLNHLVFDYEDAKGKLTPLALELGAEVRSMQASYTMKEAFELYEEICGIFITTDESFWSEVNDTLCSDIYHINMVTEEGCEEILELVEKWM